LLLTTPLSPAQIVSGQLAALRAQFKWVRLIILFLYLLMMLGGLLTRTWNGTAIAVYLLIWAYLFGALLINSVAGLAQVMWVALNTGRPIHAVYRAAGTPTTWIWILYQMRNIPRVFSGTAQFPTGSAMELVFVIFIAIIAIIAFASRRSKTVSHAAFVKLITRHLRGIVQEPIPDPNDPLFKKWDINQPFRSRTGLPRNFPLK
jgi:hypothetical protein